MFTMLLNNYVTRQSWIRAGWICAVALSASGCTRATDQDQIRSLIEECAELAEEEEILPLLDMVTEDFISKTPRMDRKQLRGGLYVMFRRYGRFGPFEVKHPYALIHMDNDEYTEASTLLPFLLVKRKSQATVDNAKDEIDRKLEEPQWYKALAGTDGELYTLHIKFRKEEGDWKVQYVSITGMRKFGTW